MKQTRPGLAAAVVVLGTLMPGTALPADRLGSALIGSVADLKGTPVPGALISLFGQGLRGGSLIAFSDESGHFVLSSLPAGSYTLRTIERYHAPSARRVTVLPNQNTVYSIVLAPLIGQLTDDESVERQRELDWLLRHKRRSVLEDEGDEASATSAGYKTPAPVAMAGAVELMTTPGTFGMLDNTGVGGVPANWSVIQLQGRMAGAGRWAVSGLVSDLEGASWKMAGEVTLDQWDGHAIRIGSGYGTWMPRNGVVGVVAPNLGAGAAFVEDQWHTSDSVTTTVGARYSYVGFVNGHSQVDPAVAVVWQARDGIRYQATFRTMTVAPGGDLVAISPDVPSTSLSLAVMDPTLQPEKVLRCTAGGEKSFGGTTVGLRLLNETTTDQLLNTFDGPESADAVRISNGRDLTTRGVVVTVGRQLGRVVGASVTYTYGAASRSEGALDPGVANLQNADFQDLAARLEAVLRSSDTRFAAFYRVNTLRNRMDGVGPSVPSSSRFDVQVRQGLPFLGGLTRTDWEILVAVRNLFYEEEEAGLLDEFAVVNPPIRVVGGISVRF